MIGSTVSPSASPRRSSRALTEPSTTGLTISRCDGLNDRLRCTGPPSVVMSLEKPWWYLTSPEGRLSGARVVELGEQVLRHLAEGVDEHVETAAVGHADDDLLHALVAGALDELVHRGDEALAAFEREALLADVLGVQVALEAFGGRQPVEDVELLLGAEVRLRADRLEALLPPALLGRLGDVHVLGADRAAVGFAQRLHDLAQGHVLGGREVGVRGAEHHVHVGLGEVVERRLELGNLRALGALQRIEVGPARAERAIRRDQGLDVDLLSRDRQVFAGSPVAESVRLGTLGERFDDRRVGHVASRRAVSRGDVLQRVEVGTPFVGNGAGVVEVGLVQLLDIRRVAAEQVRIRPGFLHHLAHLSRQFLALQWVKKPSVLRLHRRTDRDPARAAARRQREGPQSKITVSLGHEFRIASGVTLAAPPRGRSGEPAPGLVVFARQPLHQLAAPARPP